MERPTSTLKKHTNSSVNTYLMGGSEAESIGQKVSPTQFPTATITTGLNRPLKLSRSRRANEHVEEAHQEQCHYHCFLPLMIKTPTHNNRQEIQTLPNQVDVYDEFPFLVTDVNRSGPSLSRRQQEMDPENIHFDNEGLNPDLDDDEPTLPTGRESVGEAASNIAAGFTPTGVTGCSQSAQSGGTRRYSWVWKHSKIAACKSMEDKFNKYFENMPTIFIVASVMDPRIKIKGVEKLLKGLSENLGITLPSISTVTALLTSIYASYESKFACTAAAAPFSSSINDPCSTSNNENDPSWFLISGPGSSETSSRENNLDVITLCIWNL
ncbi:hypothetical protein RHSIM_Rhsim07G0152300 [Rhododendron simsii]|uniref:hAT-like transposase RNase-H fold domain-containing protein n=1 Tax=Rhododendron simsii TaxID=118357 RepID=A0A834GS11_RHOSS|nr:hypothetical protein RHSIM_Rhsim07G0152300 [Rhododendron simsii]